MPDKLLPPLQRVLALRTGGWFRATMDAYYETSEAPRSDPGWFHPSALSHPCDAFLAFSFLGIPPRAGGTSSKQRRIFDNGHSTEGRWQEAIKRAGIAQLGKKKGDRNFEIPQYRIRGELDNIVANPVTGEQSIWEFKTKREDLFDAMQAPDAIWIPQIHCYMFAKGILQTLVVVECKNCQDYKEYLVPFDHDVWNGITERIARITDRLGRRQEIARTPVPNDPACVFYPICAGYDFSKVGQA